MHLQPGTGAASIKSALNERRQEAEADWPLTQLPKQGAEHERQTNKGGGQNQE